MATRLRPISEKIPKSLIEVAGEPFICHQLRLLQRAEVKRVVVCAGHMGDLIRDKIGYGSAYGLTVEYSFDGPTLLGTAGALRRAAHLLGEGFFVLYGDSYLDCDYKKVQAAYEESAKKALMVVYENNGMYDTSNVVFSKSKIVTYSKTETTPEMKWIDYGLSVLSSSVLDEVPENQFCDLGTAFANLAHRDELAGMVTPNRFYEIGSLQGLAEFRNLMTKHNIENP